MKRNLFAKIACLLVGVAAFGTPAGATLLYFNDFESNSTANYSGTTTLTTAPSNVTKFLGPLSAGQTATLTLNGVSSYPSFNLSFDLYTLMSLDGDEPTFGPDFFKLMVNGTTTLLNNTFTVSVSATQSYGGVGSPGGTGSDPLLYGQLGFVYPPNFRDMTYHLSFDIVADGNSTIAFNFIGNSTQGWPDEGFGIDNVSVSGTPLPAALPLFATGLGALGLLGWRRKRKAAALAA